MASTVFRQTHSGQQAGLPTALLYEQDRFLESLRGAVVAAGATVAAEIRLSELTAGQLELLDAKVLLVNLETILDRRPGIFDLVLHEQGNRRLILNDAAASARLQGSDRARWVRHLAAKLGGHREWLPPRPQKVASDDSAGNKHFEVWVLGASIGGPEAVRSFLGALDDGCPMALVLAQHIGGEFVDTLCRQLAGVTTMPVRRAQHGDRILPGQVLVVPVDQHFHIDEAHRVALRDFSEPPACSPCIDDVLQTVTDRFGHRANAIIFSGMASDGVAGCRYLARHGGELWVQTPDSCVVSSMVDGALATGRVALQADPEGLAWSFNQRVAERETADGPTSG